MSKYVFRVLLTGLAIGLSAGNVFAQGFGGGGGGGGGGAGGGGFGGGAGGRTPGANVQSLGANVGQAQPLPLISSRQTQGFFGARQLSVPFQQRFRGMMGRSQAGQGAGQYATSGQYRSARQNPSSSGMSSFNSFSMGGQGAQRQAASAASRGRRASQGKGNAHSLKSGMLDVGFKPPAKPVPQFTGQLETRVAKVLKMPSVEIQLEGRTAVLRGSVATDHDRALAEQLALLEPGISFVRNEISTTDQPASETSGPATLPPAEMPEESLPDPAASSPAE